MTPQQRDTVNALKAEGFKVVEDCTDVVRLSKGSDKRLVRQNGQQMRANHIDPGARK